MAKATATATPSFKDRINPGKAPASAPAPKQADEAIQQTLRDDPRPYADSRSVPQFSAVEQFSYIYSQTGTTNDDLLGPEKEQLQKRNKQIRKIWTEIQKCLAEKFTERRDESRRRIAQGKGSKADVEFSKGEFLKGRKMLNKQMDEKKKAARPLLVEVAKRVEARARIILPRVEADSARLGVPPAQSPVARGIAMACWAPSELAKSTVDSPGRFLKRLGIKL